MTRTLLMGQELDRRGQDQSSDCLQSVLEDPRVHDHYSKRGLLGLGESYMDGDWEARHLDELMCEVFRSPAQRLSPLAKARLMMAAFIPRFIDQQAGPGAFRIGRDHYDLGNDLFKVMLDESMTYTSGYWADADTLEEAQEAKLELLCRKLDLRPGMRVLDIGCGWGNFAHHAASRHGVLVTGLTVSREQAALASDRCKGLPVDIKVEDYREVSGTYDRVVSIEMIEAVGRRNVPRFMRKVDECLAEDGLFALQVITGDMLSRTSDPRFDQFVMWLLKYIFPDGYLPHPGELSNLRGTGLRLEDWHVFSEDYDQTLMAWSERFNAGWDQLRDRYGDRFARQWNYYLHGCAAAFRVGLIGVQQILYSKGNPRGQHEPMR